MIKTKIKKAVALTGIVAISATSMVTSGLGTAYAATQIGTGSVSGTGAFNTSIIWDDLFPGTASGSVTGIKVKAKVAPTLNMEISTDVIDLGTLIAGQTATGGLFIEVGTNAKSGVSITARSGSGGLTKVDDNSIQINTGTTDGVAESYTFDSTPNVTNDSSSLTFAASGLSTTEVSNNVTEHSVYTTNKPESTNSVDDLEFVVSATSTAETPAGDYEDNITFTITGNF